MGRDRADSLFMGLMSGTSMDGIDAALVRLGDHSCTTVATLAYSYPDDLRDALIAASQNPDSLSVDNVGQLDHAVGECFRDAALELLATTGTSASDVAAIGSHGQTLRHRPRGDYPFTLQIGDPNIISSGTGITTIADFRRQDVALGGEGAPLAPAFHRWLFADTAIARITLNIGGIANITALPRNSATVLGFDTGPGNTLMDAWTRECKGQPYDIGGAWAASGQVDPQLLARLMEDPYFAEPPPKSTGFEHFCESWLKKRIDNADISPEDVQATLLELTVTTISDAISRHAPDTEEVLICGGGASNKALMKALTIRLAPATVSTTGRLGVHPDWVEAAAFAWLASRTLAGETGNLPEVTGARKAAILGAIYPTNG